jgi:hypothetical protein
MKKECDLFAVLLKHRFANKVVCMRVFTLSTFVFLRKASTMASLMREKSSQDTLVVLTTLPPPPAVRIVCFFTSLSFITHNNINDEYLQRGSEADKPLHFSEMRRVGVAEAAMHVAAQAMGLGSIDVHGLGASHLLVIHVRSHRFLVVDRCNSILRCH